MFATYSFTNSTNPYIYISGNCISLYLLLKSGIYANIILHNKNCHITPTVVIWLKIEVSGCGSTNSTADHFLTIRFSFSIFKVESSKSLYVLELYVNWKLKV